MSMSASAHQATEKEYTLAIGRRKTAVARVRVYEGKDASIVVNGKPAHEYFTQFAVDMVVNKPLELIGLSGKVAVVATVEGGGVSAQAEAVRHGIARALMLINPDNKPPLRAAGFVTRDSRKKERKKFGLKKARKAPQWSKR